MELTVKTLDQFQTPNKPRLIVACKLFRDGSVAFVDRKNSELLFGHVDEPIYNSLDLTTFIPDEYRSPAYHGETAPGFKQEGASFYPKGSGPGPKQSHATKKHGSQSKLLLPQPSDINQGFEKDQLLITFTHTDHSLVVLLDVGFGPKWPLALTPVHYLKVKDRTRSVVAISGQYFAATTPEKIVILSTFGDCLGVKERTKRDRGGLLMTDGKERLFYGDGDAFVCCRWNGTNLSEVFRYTDKRMKFPRGSAMLSSGEILVCCDSSHNIHLIAGDGSSGRVVHSDTSLSFGDADLQQGSDTFVTTFWADDQWPIRFTFKK